MDNAARVAVLMGGTSSEREVSLRSGEAVAKGLAKAGHEVVRIDLGRGRDALAILGQVRMDAAFLALHGRLGEDGAIQGVLELLGVPYTGSSVLASALCMDKVKAKELFRFHNLPTPPYYVVKRSEAHRLRQLHSSFGFPVVIKPRREGSSVGLSRADDFELLQHAVEVALEHDDEVLVERFVHGQEVTVGILNGKVLGAIEIAPQKGLYDYEAKYTAGATEYFAPPRLAEARLLGAQNLALRAAEALGASGALRVDLLLTEGQNEYVLEVNTLPGMTETSLLPKIAEGAGVEFAELCDAILKTASLHSQPKVTPSRVRATEVLFDEELESNGLEHGDDFDFDDEYLVVSDSDMVVAHAV